MQLLVTTLNCTSWPTAKKFIRYTKAHMILVQELKLEGEKLAEASQFLSKQGWKSILEGPAGVTKAASPVVSASSSATGWG